MSELGEGSGGAGTQASEGEEGLASLRVGACGKTANWALLGLLAGRSVAEAKLTGTRGPLIRKGKQTGSVAERMLPGTECKRNTSLLAPPALRSPSRALSWQSLPGSSWQSRNKVCGVLAPASQSRQVWV